MEEHTLRTYLFWEFYEGAGTHEIILLAYRCFDDQAYGGPHPPSFFWLKKKANSK